MLLMLPLCLSLFPLIHGTSSPVVSMEMFKFSTRRLVIYVDFSKAPYFSTLTCLHGFCSFFNVVGMKWIIQTGDSLDSVGNIHTIIVSTQTIVIMELNPRMEFTL